MRAEAPPCGGSQNSPRGLRHENNTAPTEAELANLQRTLFLNEANVACGAASPATAEAASFRAGRLRLAQHCKLQKTISKKTTANNASLRIAKTAEREKPARNNRKQTTIPNPPAPLRRQRIAESTNHADKSRNPCHSGSAVFGCKDSRFRRRLSLSVHFLHGCHHVSRAVGPHIRTPEQTQPRNPRPEHTR